MKSSALQCVESPCSALQGDKIENSRDTTKKIDLKPKTQTFTASPSTNSTLTSETSNVGQVQHLIMAKVKINKI